MSVVTDSDIDELTEGLPGGDIVRRGIDELKRGETSVCGLLVLSASTRLTSLGISVPVQDQTSIPAHIQLYRLLEASNSANPYSRYNALMRSLYSFMHALEHRINRGPV